MDTEEELLIDNPIVTFQWLVSKFIPDKTAGRILSSPNIIPFLLITSLGFQSLIICPTYFA